MKFTTLALIGIASFIVSSKSQNTYDGCVAVKDGVCDCYERKVLQTGKGCGPKLPKTDKCAIYSIDIEPFKAEGYCSICKPGYAQKEEINPGQNLGYIVPPASRVLSKTA